MLAVFKIIRFITKFCCSVLILLTIALPFKISETGISAELLFSFLSIICWYIILFPIHLWADRKIDDIHLKEMAKRLK